MTKTKNYVITVIILVIIVFGVYYFVIKPIKEFESYTTNPVHWHANFDVNICGEKQDFTRGYDFEENRLGTLILHTHNDNVIHIEGKIPRKEDIALGNFFDGIKVPFSSTQITDKRNEDLCSDGKPGTVKMYVNGQSNSEFRGYILKKCESQNIEQDCEKIEIKFE